MVSSSTLSCLLMQANEAWNPDGGDSTRKLKTSASQFSLVDLFSPFSPENQRSARSNAFKTVSSDTSRSSISSGSMSQTNTVLMPKTSVFHRRKGSRPVITGCRPDESELPRTEYSERIPRPEGTAMESSTVLQKSSRVETSPSESRTWDSRHESFTMGTSSSRTSAKPSASSHFSQNATNNINKMSNSTHSPQMHPQCRRSQPIAIKTTSSSSSFDTYLHSPSSLEDRERQEDELTNEQLYDMATWRMYNRIVDHRSTQQLATAGKPSVSHSTTTSYLPHALGSSYSPERYVASSGTTPTFIDELEGEVFEFEI